MDRICLFLMIWSVLAVSAAMGGCKQVSPPPDILAPLDRALVLREQSPPRSGGGAEPTTEHRVVLEKLASLGYVVDVTAYATLPPRVLMADLTRLSAAVEQVGEPSQARVERWRIVPEDEATGETGEYSLPRYPYREATARLEDRLSLPIVLLPRFADLAASIEADATEDSAIIRAVATSELWAATMYFVPQHKRVVWYRCTMPSELVRGQIFPPNGGPPIGRIGKIIGRPDDNIRKTGFLHSARKIEEQLTSGEALGVVMTGELSPGLWAFAAWEPGDADGFATWQGFAVPLLDGNGTMRGTSAFDVTPDRGSPFENLVLDVPDDLVWGRHMLYKLPRPMALARRNMPDEMRVHTKPEERIVALITSDDAPIPAVQAFVKAETWGPFAEDVVFVADPTSEQLTSGAVRALAVSASIEPDSLLRLLAAMAGRDPGETDRTIIPVP